MSAKESLILNFDDLAIKRKFMTKVGALKGLWEIDMKPRKLTRSLSQNAFYWAGVVTPFAEWLRTEWGDPSIELEQAHEMLKQKILGGVKMESAGIMMIPSSRKLNTTEFSEYVDGCANWLAEFCGIVILSPDMYFEERGKQ